MEPLSFRCRSCFNEEASIARVSRGCSGTDRHGHGRRLANIIFVDDGSTDMIGRDITSNIISIQRVACLMLSAISGIRRH